MNNNVKFWHSLKVKPGLLIFLISLKTGATLWRVGVGRQRGTKVREAGERGTGSGRLWPPCSPPTRSGWTGKRLGSEFAHHDFEPSNFPFGRPTQSRIFVSWLAVAKDDDIYFFILRRCKVYLLRGHSWLLSFNFQDTFSFSFDWTAVYL